MGVQETSWFKLRFVCTFNPPGFPPDPRGCGVDPKLCLMVQGFVFKLAGESLGRAILFLVCTLDCTPLTASRMSPLFSPVKIPQNVGRGRYLKSGNPTLFPSVVSVILLKVDRTSSERPRRRLMSSLTLLPFGRRLSEINFLPPDFPVVTVSSSSPSMWSKVTLDGFKYTFRTLMSRCSRSESPDSTPSCPTRPVSTSGVYSLRSRWEGTMR